MYFGFPSQSLSAGDLVTLTETQTIIERAHRACRERGIRFVLVFAPIKYRVYRDRCTFGAASDPANWVLSDLPDRMTDWASSKGVPFIDLTPALNDAADDGMLSYFLDDGHWTAAGHAVAAARIATFLRGTG